MPTIQEEEMRMADEKAKKQTETTGPSDTTAPVQPEDIPASRLYPPLPF